MRVAAILVLSLALAALLAGCGAPAPTSGEAELSEPRTRDAARQPETTRKAATEPEPAPEREAPAGRSDVPEEPGTDLDRLMAEEGNGHAGAYKTVAAGALTVEIPVGWEHAAGEDPGWSEFGGVQTAIAAASDLQAWYTNGIVQGTDIGASRNIARYTDDQLVASGTNALSEPFKTAVSG